LKPRDEIKRATLSEIFPTASTVGPRAWGEETLLVLASGKYTLKKLLIKAGNKGGLQFHRKKDEAGYLVSGKLLVTYENEEGVLCQSVLSAGDHYHFETGVVHQEEALEDCIIIEASTPHFNDRVRVEELHGLSSEGGLPTTNENDIELK
jgi:mannose-6-phosphate isomerase-like protein (cupin superfamily)